MKQFGTRIRSNRIIAPGWMELGFTWKAEGEIPRPGQFFTLKASPSTDPLLRRPFAFSGFSGDEARAIYQVRGPATRLLASLATDASIDIIAPLGNGFDVYETDRDRDDRSDPGMRTNGSSPPPARILVAGGIGLGPILFLAHAMAASGHGAPTAFIAGFRSADSIPELTLPAGCIVCTDDGTAGFHGSTVARVSADTWPEGTSVYACGPHPMLAALSLMASTRSWRAWFSVEQWMACGVGACMGCVVKRTDGTYARACTEGPVFRSEDIDWEENR